MTVPYSSCFNSRIKCCLYLRVDAALGEQFLGSGLADVLGERSEPGSIKVWADFDAQIHPDDSKRVPACLSLGDATPGSWDVYQLRVRDSSGRFTALRFYETDYAGGMRVGVAVKANCAAEFSTTSLLPGLGWRSLVAKVPAIVAEFDPIKGLVFANGTAQALCTQSGPVGYWRPWPDGVSAAAFESIIVDGAQRAAAGHRTTSRLIKNEATEMYASLHFVPVASQCLLIGYLQHSHQGSADGTFEERPGLSELLLASVSDPLIVADAATGQLLDANPAASLVYGWPREKLLRLRWDDLISPASDPQLMHRTPPEPGVTLCHHKRRDGSAFPVEARESTIAIKGRAVVISTIRDVTERLTAERQQSQLEARMQQAQKLESLGVLAGGIAHDFNNLLSGILGSIDLACAELSPQSQLRQSLGIARECAERAAVLCDQLLAYSGRGRFVVKPVSLNALVEELRPLLEVSLVSKPKLLFEFESGLPLIEVDVAQIRQVVLNLVMNAAEATEPSSGHVTVRSRLIEVRQEALANYVMGDQLAPGKYVGLEVTDDGCGMKPETVAKIFEPFFTTKFAGRGLGLPALMGIVKGHGGAIQVVSEVGRGSSFRVLFPTQRRRTSVVPDGAAVWHGRGCVLLADDEMPVRTIGRRILERLGFQVKLAPNGRAALEEFARDPDEISLVILDLTMPEMTGEAAMNEIRKLRPQVPIIITSGFGEEEVLERVAYAPMDGFLKKPFRMEEFTGLVQSVIERRQARGLTSASGVHSRSEAKPATNGSGVTNGGKLASGGR